MTRAEEAALKAYPPKRKEVSMSGCVYTVVGGDFERRIYQQGYEQAWKDIKEWVEEQLAILDKQILLHPDDDVFWEQRNAYKQMKDKLNSL